MSSLQWRGPNAKAPSKIDAQKLVYTILYTVFKDIQNPSIDFKLNMFQFVVIAFCLFNLYCNLKKKIGKTFALHWKYLWDVSLNE